jgi:hypothetical protein
LGIKTFPFLQEQYQIHLSIELSKLQNKRVDIKIRKSTINHSKSTLKKKELSRRRNRIETQTLD